MYKPSQKILQVNEQVTQILDKKNVLKNKLILNYFMLVASSSPV